MKIVFQSESKVEPEIIYLSKWLDRAYQKPHFLQAITLKVVDPELVIISYVIIFKIDCGVSKLIFIREDGSYDSFGTYGRSWDTSGFLDVKVEASPIKTEVIFNISLPHASVSHFPQEV